MEKYDSLRKALVDGVVRQCEAFGDDLKKALAEQAGFKAKDDIQDQSEEVDDSIPTANTGRARYEQVRRAPNAYNDTTIRKYVDKTTSTEHDSGSNNYILPEDVPVPPKNQALSFGDDTLPLEEKYGILLKKYNLMRQQAQQYKNGFERYKEAYTGLKGRFNRSKVNIKEWQDFADRARAKSTPRAQLEVGHVFHSPRARPVRRHSIQEGSRPGWLQSPERGHTEENAINDETNLLITPLSMEVERNHDPRDSNLQRAHSTNKIFRDVQTFSDQGDNVYQPVPPQVDTNSSNPTDPLQNHSSGGNNGPIPPSSQTTEEELSTKDAFTGLDDDFEPVVVSERSLKRKRSTKNADGSSRLKKSMPSSQDGSTRKPIKIKDEPLSSSPIGPVATTGLFHEQSLDLDDMQGFVFTPKKRRERRERRERMDETTRQKTSSKHYQSQRREDIGTRAISAPVDSLNGATGSRMPALESREVRSFADTSKEEDGDDEMLLTGDANPTSDKSHAEGSKNIEWNVGFSRRSEVLQPRSVNDLVTPRGNEKTARSRKSRSIKDREIAELAEDEEVQAGLQLLATHQKPSSARINSLLEGAGMPDRTPLTSTPIARAPTRESAPLQLAAPRLVTLPKLATPSVPQSQKGRHSWMRVAVPTPGSRSAHTPSAVLSLAKSKASPSTTMRERSDQARPEQEPLRARPLHRLDLECFKINPKSNDGYNYAFNDVVRNQAARACLPGCTLPSCCGGAFEKAIELGGALPPPKRGLWDDSQEDPDDALLREYLGGKHSRINAMSAQERARLLTKARANKLAEMHGKHRQAHQRQASPPGFWRMEMPTTQENEEDRRKAKELERQKVAERHREAMRPGNTGRWIFADE